MSAKISYFVVIMAHVLTLTEDLYVNVLRTGKVFIVKLMLMNAISKILVKITEAALTHREDIHVYALHLGQVLTVTHK